MANRSSNRVLVPEAKHGLNQFKMEVATELGLSNYDSMDKGNLTSRQNGSVGGEMVKRMVEAYQRNL
ncbi:alpha/beta-type small acid-soluble spore protein [Clostridium sp. MSJ-11]|uniref:Alpha/beta-type small acid-soluble spore protein n=1 Tax=Clostridium mobile TaxID=2841512 RepID=A0ABS6EBZ6_9CLOT|nr:alpha/beta-type small acid-soluble spore protein [Clostridium mobile]MBU5482715.1 alpha/beta-type small acid-soluble spore protein [Clostridium mobile]